MPFKSSILVADKDGLHRSQIKVRCVVEDQVNNRIVFKIGADPPAATLTYRLSINDIEPERVAELNAINRTIEYSRVEIAPKQSKRERFLLSAFNSFAPDIDQVTIKTTQHEVKFIGSSSPLLKINNTTSEFTHKRDDFMTFNVKEEINVTIPLRYLKLFLTFVETNRVQTFPRYIFEGVGLPAHFIYDAQLYKGHFISSTPYEYAPPEIEDEPILPIDVTHNGDHLLDDNIIGADDELRFEHDFSRRVDESELDDEDGYNDNESETSEFLDGDLEGLDDTCLNKTTASHYAHSMMNESIRSGMTNEPVYDPEKVKEILDVDKEPDDIENMEIQYSSSDSDDDL